MKILMKSDVKVADPEAAQGAQQFQGFAYIG